MRHSKERKMELTTLNKVRFASQLLKDMAQTLADGNPEAKVAAFAYTDYGGDAFDVLCCKYFEENYPEYFAWESTIYSGRNGILVSPPDRDLVGEFEEAVEEYVLGFEDMESAYTELEVEALCEAVAYFIDSNTDEDGEQLYDHREEEIWDWMWDNGRLDTQGWDYSEHSLIEYLEKMEG
jgi:hypothetical protein